jgi:hypothetical protein
LYILAWLHWALGHGTLAFVHLAEASRLAPELEEVDHLDWMLRNGVLPAWAFDRDEDGDEDYGEDTDEDEDDDDEDDGDTDEGDESGRDPVHLHHGDGDEHE